MTGDSYNGPETRIVQLVPAVGTWYVLIADVGEADQPKPELLFWPIIAWVLVENDAGERYIVASAVSPRGPVLTINSIFLEHFDGNRPLIYGEAIVAYTRDTTLTDALRAEADEAIERARIDIAVEEELRAERKAKRGRVR